MVLASRGWKPAVSTVAEYYHRIQPHRAESKTVSITGTPMRFMIVIEKGPRSYGAYVPDLPGCVAAGRTVAQVRRLIREAIALHLDDMRRAGQRIPKPTSTAEFVEASAA